MYINNTFKLFWVEITGKITKPGKIKTFRDAVKYHSIFLTHPPDRRDTLKAYMN